MSSSTLHRSCYLWSQISSGYISTRPQRPSPAAHFDEFVYSAQVTLPEESDQLRLHRHSATAPGAQQLTLTSSSTLHRSRYLRSEISSGYIATRPQRPEPSSSLLTSSSTQHKSLNLRDQFNSGKLADEAQRLTLTSSSIQHRPRSLGISSTQVNQPTQPNSLHG